MKWVVALEHNGRQHYEGAARLSCINHPRKYTVNMFTTWAEACEAIAEHHPTSLIGITPSGVCYSYEEKRHEDGTVGWMKQSYLGMWIEISEEDVYMLTSQYYYEKDSKGVWRYYSIF